METQKPPTISSLSDFDLDKLINLDSEDQLYSLVSGQFNEINRGFYARANLELLNHLNLTGAPKVLDLACGTGHLAIEIAKKIPEGKVVGVDLSPEMLEMGREDARGAGVTNIEFIQKDIHHILPEYKSGSFDVGISCFALSYLGTNFLLKELREILGARGQVGITTSSVNSLVEWHQLFMQFFMEHADQLDLSAMPQVPDMPADEKDMIRRMEEAGFEKVQVISQEVPLLFDTSQSAAGFLISSGWLSNQFYSIPDKTMRRAILDWAIQKIGELHQNDSGIITSIEFLIAFNEPAR